MIGTKRQQEGSVIRVKNKTTLDCWYLRYYEVANGIRAYRSKRLGTVKDLPTRIDARRAARHILDRINAEVRTPETVGELIEDYKLHELSEDADKRSSTKEVYTGFLKTHIAPKWGNCCLHEVKTLDVEKWLRTLALAPATKTKIRNIMSVVFAHAKRAELLSNNPIEGVRCSSKRLKEPEVLTPMEFKSLVAELADPMVQMMVLLAGTTGLRRGELIALQWHHVNFASLEIRVQASCVRGKLGETKTAGSSKPVPLHAEVAKALQYWRGMSLYGEPSDFLFASVRNNGKLPVWPGTVLDKVIRPAGRRAGIQKTIGWHTLRHSFATDLRFLNVDVKVAQELLRHTSASFTLNFYTQAVSSQKREASDRVVEMLLPNKCEAQHCSALLSGEKVALALAS